MVEADFVFNQSEMPKHLRREQRRKRRVSVLIKEREGAGPRRDNAAAAGGMLSRGFTPKFISWVKQAVIKGITLHQPAGGVT